MLDMVKDMLSKDISGHIPYMVGVVGTGGKKINTTRLSEVFIPYAVLAYIIFTGMAEIKLELKEVRADVATMKADQLLSSSNISKLEHSVGNITSTLQKIGFAKLTE